MKGIKKMLDKKSVDRVKKYLDLGINQSEIAKILQTTRQQVNRWTQHIEKARNTAVILDVDKK